MLKPGKARHEQISSALRDQIQQGQLSPDDQLPSESQLGEQYGVSRITVRRALQTLEQEGLIYRRQGLGSFVQDHRLPQGLVRLNDFVEDMTQAGLVASSQVLHFGPEAPKAGTAEALGLVGIKQVYRLDRLRLADGTPVAVDRTWLPVVYGHLLEGHDLEQETIFHILERDYGVPVLRGRYRIEAVAAPAEVAAALGISRGRPVQLIERTSYTEGDRALYYQRRYYRSDRVAYELELVRSPDAARKMALREFEPVFKMPPPETP